MQSNRWRRHRVVQRAVKKHIDDIHNIGHDDSVIADDTDHSVINTLESNPFENNVTHDFDSVNADDDSLPVSDHAGLEDIEGLLSDKDKFKSLVSVDYYA